jgi:hypothetical protein
MNTEERLDELGRKIAALEGASYVDGVVILQLLSFSENLDLIQQTLLRAFSSLQAEIAVSKASFDAAHGADNAFQRAVEARIAEWEVSVAPLKPAPRLPFPPP